MSNRKFLFALLVIILVPLLAACSEGTTTASCAFVVGTGHDGYDAKLHRVVYPGQQYINRAGETIRYVPCNSRNYIINDGKEKNANGQTVGDRGTMIVAATKQGSVINLKVRALWTLNQSQQAMADFYTVCFKYTCWSVEDKGGGANFSEPGWNGMLAENFGPAMDASARKAAIKTDNTIWQNHDPAQYKTLGDEMSKEFGDAVRANLGFPEDLFCGSGNSGWTNKDKPGEGEFTCSPVRIIVDDVQVVPTQTDQGSQGAESVNTQRFKNAQAIYGQDASYWLGLQDAIEKCKAAGVFCIINIGGMGGGPAVSVPAPVVPAPTPVKK